jgi:hypothetical protein
VLVLESRSPFGFALDSSTNSHHHDIAHSYGPACRKAFPELVRNRDEQLSAAVCFESEWKAVVRSIDVPAMQVSAISIKLFASLLLFLLPDLLWDVGE